MNHTDDAPAAAPPARPNWRAMLALMRPRQWAKNVFVLAPLLFTGQFRHLVECAYQMHLVGLVVEHQLLPDVKQEV